MILPPIKWREVKNANASNHMLFIEIEPQMPFSTLAQEVAEWQRKALVWVPAGLVGLVFGAFAGWQIAGVFAAVLAGLIGLCAGVVIGNNAVSGTRSLEYWGRAVDVAAGGDIVTLVKELSGYSQFRHAVPLETIKAEIGKRIPKALVWLENHEAALKRIYDERLGR